MADANDIIRLAVEYGLPAASQALNVFYLRILGGASDSDVLDDLEEWVTNEWGANWQDLACSLSSIIGFAADVVDFEGHVLANIGSRTLALAGTVVTDPTSAGDAAYLKADTATPKTRGSKYIPGLAEDNVDVGILDATALGELAVLFADYFLPFVGLFSSVSYEPGVPSRVLLSWHPFTGGGSFTDIIAYQRRRKLGVGS
jgi:hypothetical protein